MYIRKKGEDVGFVYARVLICNPTQRERCQEMEMLVDTGAILSVIPRDILARLGVLPDGRRRFKGFGGIIERETGTLTVKYQQDSAGITAVFGEEDDAPILGVTALEALGYQVNPATGEMNRLEEILLL